jgi:protein SCO1/2
MFRRSLFTALLLFTMSPIARAQLFEQNDLLSHVGIDQKLQAQVPLQLRFRDETGRDVQLSEYFNGKPVILVLAYYRCPMLCTQVLNGLAECIKAMPLAINQDFRVLTVSIDPRETSELAAEKKKTYLRSIATPEAEDGWHFFVGDESAIQQLSESVGYRFAYDAAKDQFAHGSGIMVLTPQGKVSRYFLGINYPSGDVKLSLVEAANGRIGSLADQLLLLCFHYDETTGRYTPAIMAMVRVLAVITLCIVFGFILRSHWRDRRRASGSQVPQPTH